MRDRILFAIRCGDSVAPIRPGRHIVVNVGCFARPTRLGDIGNMPRNSFRMPSIFNNDLALFKNIQIGGETRSLQLRWEVYNVFNHTNFRDIDAGLVFRRQRSTNQHALWRPNRRTHTACDAGTIKFSF